MKKITKIFLATVLAVLGTVGIVAPSFAKIGGMDCENPNLKNEIGDTAYNAVCGGEDGETSDIGDSIGEILKRIIGVTGIIAAIFIVVGAITYITASGDPGKIKKGRDTIIYALIGLVLAGLAFVITNAVVGAVNESSSSETSSEE